MSTTPIPPPVEITGETLSEAYRTAMLHLIHNPEESIAEATAGFYFTDPPEASPRKGFQVIVTAMRGSLKKEEEKSLIIT